MTEQNQFNSSNNTNHNMERTETPAVLVNKCQIPNQGQTAGVNKAPQASRQTNLQRIQQKKQAVLAFPYNKKILKLAIYSKCQVNNY
jgi:hypothetical protein